MNRAIHPLRLTRGFWIGFGLCASIVLTLGVALTVDNAAGVLTFSDSAGVTLTTPGQLSVNSTTGKLQTFEGGLQRASANTVEVAAAQTAADDAQVDATTALANAATAQTAADDAQVDATTALANAATAQTTANAALPRDGSSAMSGDLDIAATAIVSGAGSDLLQAATSAVALGSTTRALALPSLTTAQRDALTGADGMLIWNTTTGELNQYDGLWTTVGSGVTDHGALTGLADDDHAQYVLAAGDTMAGDLVVPDDVAIDLGTGDAKLRRTTQANCTTCVLLELLTSGLDGVVEFAAGASDLVLRKDAASGDLFKFTNGGVAAFDCVGSETAALTLKDDGATFLAATAGATDSLAVTGTFSLQDSGGNYNAVSIKNGSGVEHFLYSFNANNGALFLGSMSIQGTTSATDPFTNFATGGASSRPIALLYASKATTQTITLPAAVGGGTGGRTITVCCTGTAATCTVDATGGDTISGSASDTLIAPACGTYNDKTADSWWKIGGT